MRRASALLAIVLVLVICSAQTTYKTSEGFTIDSATRALLVTAQPVAPTWTNSKGLLIDATGAVVVALAGSGTTLYQETGAGTTTNSNNSADVNMFTGYTLPASTLTAGHRLVITACFRHTTGTTTTLHKFSMGGVATNLTGTNAGTSVMCVTENVFATDATHQYVMQPSTSNPTPALIAPIGPTALTLNLATSNVINFTQNAAGTADVYTAYAMTVDLY
jgi:hypothetical protein